jgi:hypothetical protein
LPLLSLMELGLEQLDVVLEAVGVVSHG